MSGRKKSPRFGVRRLAAEYGMAIELTKPEALGPEQAASLQERGVRFMAVCLDAEDQPDCLVFAPTKSGAEETAGLFCRALGEARQGLDPGIALRMALSEGNSLIQMTERAADLLRGYVLELQGASGNCGLRIFEGLSDGAGELPAEMTGPCRCERCAGRGGW